MIGSHLDDETCQRMMNQLLIIRTNATGLPQFLSKMTEKPTAGQHRTQCKRSFSSFKNESGERDHDIDNVFGFMDDSDATSPKQKAIDDFPVYDLSENPTYLMEFGYGNGFVWNEEVLLVRISV